MQRAETNLDVVALALAALGWVVSAPDRAERLLSLTGLDPQTLRDHAAAPATLAAVLAFLEAHEPDLLACADALGVKPEALVAAHHHLDAA
ncbi:MAG: DUF3572 family protein [Sphingomonas sp.]